MRIIFVPPLILFLWDVLVAFSISLKHAQVYEYSSE